jgi:CRISPR system Cascade subunit CasD
MPAHLLLRLEAPLMSFGSTAVDHRRPVQAWPAVSMLTGLLANALGWDRSDSAALDRLQARIRWAARIDRPGTLLNDFQTAQLAKDDRGWTTRGVVETRGGGDASYESPHLRYRDYRADASVLVALRLDPVAEFPNLTDLAAALDAPLRPLFLGRLLARDAHRPGPGGSRRRCGRAGPSAGHREW